MNITKIPFAKLVGIEKDVDSLTLEYKKDVLNHLNTFHAGAQFSLAESASGMHLQELFPDLVGKVVPILRDANIKYKKPATKKLRAHASVSDEQIQKFTVLFSRKKRGTIVVDVKLVDADDITTSISTFTWFVQKI